MLWHSSSLKKLKEEAVLTKAEYERLKKQLKNLRLDTTLIDKKILKIKDTEREIEYANSIESLFRDLFCCCTRRKRKLS